MKRNAERSTRKAADGFGDIRATGAGGVFIISEKRGTMTTTYAYDALGQLIRVNDPHENVTWVYEYDRGGNITSKVKYAYTTGTVGTAIETIPYTYGDTNWKDKLTSYNGQTITYDAIGNPLNDGIWTYEWQDGRQLKRMSAEGTVVSFKYDHNGLRTQKIVEQDWYPVTTNYTLHGKLLTHMTVDYTDWDEMPQQDKLHFFYDAQSRPVNVEFNDEMYTYLYNLQGDIVAIVDSVGSVVVEYKYDAWGKLLSTTGAMADTLGKRNPFHYRGYVYDEETGLYYLRSRYYNPTTERFVNADVYIGKIASLGRHNQYSYCANVPVTLCDENGKSFGDAWKDFWSLAKYRWMYESQINFWTCISIGLSIIDCGISADLLSHSLQPNPPARHFSNDSGLVKKIKSSSEFKTKLGRIIAKKEFNVETSMSFDSDFDLFGSIHRVSMVVSPVTINGKNMYHVTMTDIYDFKYEEEHYPAASNLIKRAMKAGAIWGNNLAYSNMNLGAINEYEITIDFYVE